MTADEAKARGAKEIHHHTSRRRASSGAGGPHTPTTANALDSPTILIQEPSAIAAKGKQA